MSPLIPRKNKENCRRLPCAPAAVCLLLLALSACAPSSALRLVPAEPPLTSEQRYRLLLHGGVGFNDFETVAVLDRQDDNIQIVSNTGTIKVRVLEGMTASEALAEARVFLSRNNYFSGMETKAIIGPEGRDIGYEIRPRYSPLAGRLADDLDTTYLPGPDDTVILYVYYPPGRNEGADDPPISQQH